MENMKLKAIAKFLGENEEDITGEEYTGIFEFEDAEYMVLTEDEADEMAKEYILESLWAFKSDFIIEHSNVLDYDSGSRKIISAIQEQYEDGNEAIKKLIDDLDEFVEDAINSDGRGNFLSNYDGDEYEQNDYYIYRIN